MDIDEIFERIKNKELTICETCDNIFDYTPHSIYCDECRIAMRGKYVEDNREKSLQAKEKTYRRQKKYYKKNREDILEKWKEKLSLFLFFWPLPFFMAFQSHSFQTSSTN